jgi:hypothetical protein
MEVIAVYVKADVHPPQCWLSCHLHSQGFGPELFGKPLDDEEILDTQITKKGNLTYYEWWVLRAVLIHSVLLL